MLVKCPHCDGTGLCQDAYHDDTFSAAAKELFGSNDDEGPSGCGGGQYHRGVCQHCHGNCSIDDSLL